MVVEKAVLIVDDDSVHRMILKKHLNDWGYQVNEADDGHVAVEAVRRMPFDLIIMDICMLNVSGIEALGQIKAINPETPVIIMTAYASLETAVSALKKGAYDYLTKPLNFDELRIAIGRATEHNRLKKENRYLRNRLDEKFNRQNLIGQSYPMVKLLETVAQVAPTEANVLITGESGTGKELIANAIHFNSMRAETVFIKINCSALTETLLESELFGHEKGAFTGAERRREGKFLQAHGGSLFLDEVSEMSKAMQVKLLRVLQERELTRVGGAEVIKVDVRVIAASNKNLKEEVQNGNFREDLFYRLNVVSLNVPPLRERKEDIPILAQHFLELFAGRNKKTIKAFTPRAMEKLLAYHWPGNIRELMNAVERSVVLSRTDYLDADDMTLVMEKSHEVSGIAEQGEAIRNLSLESMEKKNILAVLADCRGNKSETARRLGITRKTLRAKLIKYEMNR
ncbi:MAG: sigma-54-dependent Fis family transcriptional regulator [Smithella sp.]|nr:sigma-54-dependent Fis family transcriptional regulator [Smithella sp.]